MVAIEANEHIDPGDCRTVLREVRMVGISLVIFELEKCANNNEG
jgi:hypothetical protein